MRGRSSGIEVPLGEHAWVTTFRDGLMIHSKLYMSQAEALQAAGGAGVGRSLHTTGRSGGRFTVAVTMCHDGPGRQQRALRLIAFTD